MNRTVRFMIAGALLGLLCFFLALSVNAASAKSLNCAGGNANGRCETASIQFKDANGNAADVGSTAAEGLPVRSAPFNLTALAGSQVGLTISSATALTVPTGATVAVIQPQGTNNGSGVCAFWRDDGTNPTGTAGQALAANTSMTYAVVGLPIKLIAATGATCTATISYYK